MYYTTTCIWLFLDGLAPKVKSEMLNQSSSVELE